MYGSSAPYAYGNDGSRCLCGRRLLVRGHIAACDCIMSHRRLFSATGLQTAVRSVSSRRKAPSVRWHTLIALTPETGHLYPSAHSA